MAIWTRTPNLEHLAKSSENTAVSYMGIEYLEIGDDYVKGRMPVDERTVQ
ncbi:MAG TPA: esterase, partial [Gammaproteobacteria bacterium]|nr:esterase [Gammaproteobacteria bacterium]